MATRVVTPKASGHRQAIQAVSTTLQHGLLPFLANNNQRQLSQMADSAETWELSKENYVPVRSGRKQAALAELTDPADSATKQNLEKRKR